MNSPYSPSATSQTAPGAVGDNKKPLWIAVGALGAAVLALGGTLAYTQMKPAATPADAVAMAPAAAVVAPAATTPAPKAQAIIDEPAPRVTPAPKPAPKVVHRAPAPVRHDGYNNGYPTGNVGQTPGSYQVAQPAPRQVCVNCGLIESVTPVQRAGQTNGVGAVAGGVLGAIVGNQVGHGNGRAAATVLGAVGGGYAGNAVQRNINKSTTYQVRVRMEDGSYRTVEQATAPAIGARVTVDGNVLRGTENAAYGPAPAPNSGYVNTTGSAY